MDILDLEYEQRCERCSQLASIVWDNAFLTGLRKFSKSELIYLCCLLSQKYNEKTIPIYSELDFIDSAFCDKCTIIETLKEDFFKIKGDC